METIFLNNVVLAFLLKKTVLDLFHDCFSFFKNAQKTSEYVFTEII